MIFHYIWAEVHFSVLFFSVFTGVFLVEDRADVQDLADAVNDRGSGAVLTTQERLSWLLLSLFVSKGDCI